MTIQELNKLRQLFVETRDIAVQNIQAIDRELNDNFWNEAKQIQIKSKVSELLQVMGVDENKVKVVIVERRL